MKFDKKNNRFILERDELAVLGDVVSSLKVVAKDYNGILLDLRQEIENADYVLNKLPKHWWADSKLLDKGIK